MANAEEWRVVGDEQFTPYSFIEEGDGAPRAAQFSDALERLRQNGKLEAIYRHWQ